MLGFSIQAPVFLGKPSRSGTNDLIANYENAGQFLQALKVSGIGSIEVRILPRGADPQSYQEMIDLIWSMGLRLTIHGHVAGEHPGTRFIETYPSMAHILKHFHKYQDRLTMTLHAFDAKTGSEEELHRKTVKLLREWTAMVDAEELPLRFAVENNRKKAGKVDPGDSIRGVVRMVEEIDHPAVGICFDMGHYYSNLLSEKGLKHAPDRHFDELPEAGFLEKVFHTHIHGIGESGTHNPLTEERSLPLELYVDALHKAGYQGIYNLELTLDKFETRRSASEHVLASVQRVKEAEERCNRP
ncbi:sugar phosphate isomerase/epimerase family protein [Paenibacillus hamazuiensis]|uniref:sugar phosphate isomerase/epimerase family protein n=1 Tax=Paenibacillus hamazuiensis TaxID=2936508 RepID=UPI00200F476D|nr:TIM barrel protein [Paenibacillus hamazuiensis]